MMEEELKITNDGLFMVKILDALQSATNFKLVGCSSAQIGKGKLLIFSIDKHHVAKIEIRTQYVT